MHFVSYEFDFVIKYKAAYRNPILYTNLTECLQKGIYFKSQTDIYPGIAQFTLIIELVIVIFVFICVIQKRYAAD